MSKREIKWSPIRYPEDVFDACWSWDEELYVKVLNEVNEIFSSWKPMREFSGQVHLYMEKFREKMTEAFPELQDPEVVDLLTGFWWLSFGSQRVYLRQEGWIDHPINFTGDDEAVGFIYQWLEGKLDEKELNHAHGAVYGALCNFISMAVIVQEEVQ